MENKHLMVTLSESEMLTLWKHRLGIIQPHTECEIERIDGINIDLKLTYEIKAWYDHLLHSADACLLPVTEVHQVSPFTIHSDGCAEVQLPSNVVRPVAVQLSSWHCAVTEFLSPDSLKAQLQHCDWLKGGCERPVAVYDGNVLRLYSAAGSNDSILSLKCITLPAAGTYVMAYSALDSIPKSID